MIDQRTRSRPLCLPLQAAPVDRTVPAGALGAPGVEADDLFGDILGGVSKALPVITSTLPALAGLI